MPNRGSILILTVWAILVFSIMAASLALKAGGQILLLKREIAGFKTRLDFESGLNALYRVIQDDPHPHEDSKDEPWFGVVKLDADTASFLSVRAQDEESKINLNHASAAFLTAFLKVYEDRFGSLKGDPKEYVKAILKLRYAKRIESLEELFLVQGFEKEDYEKLKQYWTVYPEFPFVNPNTANPLVLEALVQSLGADHSAKQMLAGRLEEVCYPSGCFFRSDDLSPERFIEALKLPKTPLMQQLVQELVVLLSTDSETFEIVMRTPHGAEATGVFRARVGQIRPEVMAWHEN